MINVRVGDQEKINPGRVIAFRIPVALFYLPASLVHPAVNREAVGPRFQHVAGAGDGPGRPQKT